MKFDGKLQYDEINDSYSVNIDHDQKNLSISYPFFGNEQFDFSFVAANKEITLRDIKGKNTWKNQFSASNNCILDNDQYNENYVCSDSIELYNGHNLSIQRSNDQENMIIHYLGRENDYQFPFLQWITDENFDLFYSNMI